MLYLDSGTQLRQDDPSALKDIVLLIQPAVAQAGEASLSVRTKFMIDTITDLKNNKMKTGQAASAVSSEHITRMRKILGSLNSRNIRASEPLRLGRMDIHNSEKRGKWWLVGASWKDNSLANPVTTGSNTNAVLPDTLGDEIGGEEVDLVQLAKSHRMNTDVRRAIFIAIMSATDYRDAHVRLNKLRLKRNQELEIPRVLIHCAAEEKAHNPYYTLIARKLCGERNIKKAFMYSLWDIFKRMGERNDFDEENSDADADVDSGDNAPDIKSIVNLAKMYGTLVAEGAQTLGIFKILNFAYLQPKTRTFVELLLITAILRTQQKKLQQKRSDSNENDFDEKPLVDIFMRTRETPQIVRGLIYFMRKVVAKSDIPASKREKKIVKWGSTLAHDTLKVVAEGGSTGT